MGNKNSEKWNKYKSKLLFLKVKKSPLLQKSVSIKNKEVKNAPEECFSNSTKTNLSKAEATFSAQTESDSKKLESEENGLKCHK